MTAKHKKNIKISQLEKNGKNRKTKKNAKKQQQIFFCKHCDFIASHKGNWDKHLLTAKHRRKEQKSKNRAAEKYKCRKCSKIFKGYSGRWKHEKKCISVVEQLKEENGKLREELLECRVKHLQEKVAILEKQKTTKTPFCENAGFFQQNINVNFFLNEKCKNAMSIMDFIKELQFTLTDINPERPASTIESLSKVIVEKLGDMAETERPMHCADTKRLKFYVKDASGWTKDEDNKKIDKAIGWANMRHQGAWYDRIKEEGLDKTKKDTTYHTMNVAMAKFSDDPKKAKRKIKRAIAGATNLKDADFNKLNEPI